VYIPHHFNTDKSKLFFFWSQNWRAYRQGTVISTGTPSMLMREGNFSECDQASPNYNPVVASGCVVPMTPSTSPSPGIPFPNDTVPINPNAQTLLNSLVPLPNNGPIGYISAPSVPTNWREELIRVDENISSKAQLFVRYTKDNWNTVAIPSLWTTAVSDSTGMPLKKLVMPLICHPPSAPLTKA
jgi:hypothetical protein